MPEFEKLGGDCKTDVLIVGGGSEYAELFDPQRSMIRKQLLINGFKYASSLLKPFGNRCPHLGCRLE